MEVSFTVLPLLNLGSPPHLNVCVCLPTTIPDYSQPWRPQA